MLAESLPYPPMVVPVHLLRVRNAFLPPGHTKKYVRTRNFGTMLEPRYIVGTGRLDQ
jgi:hypothetical protein